MDLVENSYTLAADNHNVANGDQSWFSKRLDSLGDFYGKVGNAATYGSVGAITSGAISLMNSAGAIGNFIDSTTGGNGKAFDEINTHKVLSDFDSDLGKYYETNKGGVDLAGFVVGSLIPGTLGVKAFKAAEAGVLGTNFARSSGLLQMGVRDYAAAARADVIAGRDVATLMNKNLLGQITQGFGSAAIESTAFELAVAASMFKSPVLDGQSFGDLGHNVVMGTLIGGGIGGALSGAKAIYSLKKVQTTIGGHIFPFQVGEELGIAATPADNIIQYTNQKLALQDFDLLSIGPRKTDPESIAILGRQQKTKEDSIRKLDSLVSQEFQKMSGGDTDLAVTMHELFKTEGIIKTPMDIQNALLHAQGISRISVAESKELNNLLTVNHAITSEDFAKLANGSGDFSSLLVGGSRKKGEAVFELTAPTTELRLGSANAAASLKSLTVQEGKIGLSQETATAGEGIFKFGNKEAAFAADIDVFYNKNGSISVNPNSTRIRVIEGEAIRKQNTQVVDLEKGNIVVNSAQRGLSDLGKVEVKGNAVRAGDTSFTVKLDNYNFDVTKASVHEVEARKLFILSQKDLSFNGRIIGEYDIPFLEAGYDRGATGFKIRTADGLIESPQGKDLRNFIQARKDDIVGAMAGEDITLLERRINAPEKFITGEALDLWQKFADGPGVNAFNEMKKPRYAVVDFGTNAIPGLDRSAAEAETYWQLRRQAIRDRQEQTAAKGLGKDFETMPEVVNLREAGRTPTGGTAGSTFFGAANAGYGTVQQWAQSLGQWGQSYKTKKQELMSKKFNSTFTSIANNPEFTAEMGIVTNKLRSITEAMVFHPYSSRALGTGVEEAANHQLIPLADVIRAGGKPGNLVITGETVTIKNREVVDAFLTHSELNAERQPHWNNMKGDAGAPVSSNSNYPVVYPIPVQPKGNEYFLLTRHKGDGSTAFLVAKDEQTLRQLKASVEESGEIQAFTKQDIKDRKLELGEYEYEKGFNDKLINSALARTGKLTEFLPNLTPEKVVGDFYDWHMRQEAMLATALTSHRYSAVFDELKQLGSSETALAGSRKGSINEKVLEGTAKNPYLDIVKTALNISKASEYQWWTTFNDVVKNSIEKPVNLLRDAFQSTKHINEAFVKTVNDISEFHGMGPTYRNTAEALIANKNIPDKPWLAPAIAKVQAVLSTTILQTDFFNAVNTYLGAPILGSAELKFITNGIKNGDPEIAGRLSELLSVKVPGQEITMPSIARLNANSLAAMHGPQAEELTKFYNEIGTITTAIHQERQALGNLAIDFKNATQKEVESKLDKYVEFARTISGNKMAEEKTRFMASHNMKQLTDLAQEAGILNQKQSVEYIQNYVNKVQGNYNASQRPVVFQGVVGQAIGLFQTYQFNLMQQMFKYVGEGDAKSLTLLGGLQTSIYGLQGTPGFNFLNTHIVGNAAGNTNHKDLYTASYTTAGKELGDWLLYGLGSNALSVIDPSLKLSIYSRGDINPRNLTILPNPLNPTEIPIVSTSIKFATNIFNMAQKIGDGGNFWDSFSQAVEHNGISRPLSGLGAVAQGYTTTNKGSLLSQSQDFWSIANSMRVLGGKPFDESIALDGLYRMNAYKAKDRASINDLGEAVKSTIIAGGHPSSEQLQSFMASYVKDGGNQENFNRFMVGMSKTASQSQVNKLAETLRSPYGQNLQVILGGKLLPGALNIPQVP